MRIVAAASLLIVVVLGTLAPGVAGGSPKARSSAIALLETLTVPAAPKGGAVVKTRTSLRKDRTYRLVASGSITQTKSTPGLATVTYTLDPLYCFGSSDPLTDGCTTARPTYTPRLDVTLPPSTIPVADFDVLTPGGRAPFSSQGRYEATFKAPGSGPVYARTEPVPDVNEDSYSGSYKLELYGEAARKKQKKRKKKSMKRFGCPVTRTSDAHASAACHWYVNFEIHQRGEPEDDPLPPPAFTERGETNGLGKVFFNREPDAGRSVRGIGAGVIVYQEEVADPGGPLDGTRLYRLRPTSVTYLLRHNDDRKLDLFTIVTRAEAESEPGSGRPPPPACGGGDLVRLELFDDRFDQDRLGLRLRDCEGHGGGTYRYEHAPRGLNKNVLEIEISRPKRL